MRIATILLAAMLSVALLGVAARAAEPDLAERIGAAEEAFRGALSAEGSEARRAGFARAARLYESVREEHPSGALAYDAGNAWFLAGDVGRAVLSYRRALLARPGDPRIEANLATARAARRDVIGDEPGAALADRVFFWHRGLSLRTKVPLALGAWAAGFALLAAVVLRGGRRGRAVAAVLLGIAAAVGASAAVDLAGRAARDQGVVVAAEAVLRKGDGESYPPRYENPIHAGAEVRILGTRGGWTEIELGDGKSGWVPAAAVLGL